MSANKETLGFQAEVKQLLNLMIHSLYSNKEIFLRELISNASDACDKLRFEALNNAALYGDDGELKIRLAFDKDARTITISDNGIGLSREEAVEHLGTIAKSGTREFFAALTGDRKAGMAMAEVFPFLRHLDLPDLVKIEDVDFSKIDLAFCALPHATRKLSRVGLFESFEADLFDCGERALSPIRR